MRSANTGSHGEQWSIGDLSRRDFLRLAGAAAGAGAGFVVVGAASSEPVELVAHASAAASNGTFRFQSRPDLTPPQIVVDVSKPGVADGMIVTESHSGPGQRGPMILDSNGGLVWFKPLSKRGGPRAYNVQVQRYRGQPVLCWFVGFVVSAHGVGHYEIYDQSYREVAQVHAGNGYQGDLHEFFLTDAGTAIFTSYGRGAGRVQSSGRTRQVNYFYGVVQEVDVATGSVLFQWRSDQHIPLNASYTSPPFSSSHTWDYFHINSIAIDPADGNLVVSARNTWACYKIHRRTGRVLWTLGGKYSDFHLTPQMRFAFQHHVVPHPGGVVTIFDNEGGPPREASQSRALVLALDERARRVRYYKQYLHRPPVSAGALGSVQPVGRGHTFVGWGNPSYFTEFDRFGRVLLDGRLAPHAASYRAFKQPWTGQPVTDPDLALIRSGPAADLYVSWNGATQVASWRVLGGESAQTLSELGITPKRGFETRISVAQAPAWLTVQALDEWGRVLGSSAPTG